MTTDSNKIRTNEPIDSTPVGTSVIPRNRLDYLISKCRETLLHNPGNVLEVGVYKAGSLIELAETVRQVCPQFKVFGIDTFSGHPYTDNHPVHPSGKYGDINITEIEQLIADKGLAQWVTLYTGKVEEIFYDLHLSNIAFAHIDCDLYTPVKFCAENVPEVMKSGGVLYFDDYGHEHCPGATRAIEEVLDKTKLQEVFMPDDLTCWSCHLQL